MSGKDSSPFSGMPAPAFAPVMGQVTCQMSRDELKQLFEQSAYGSNTALFEAYFVKDSRPPLCIVCRSAIPQHTNVAPTAEDRAVPPSANAQQKTELPDTTIDGLREQVLAYNRKNDARMLLPYAKPPHWRDSAYRVFSYYSFKEMDIVFRNQQAPLVKAVWQCEAGREGAPCPRTVLTEGLHILHSNDIHQRVQAGKAGLKSFGPMKAEEMSTLKAHLMEMHNIDVDAPFKTGGTAGTWSTGLCGCAEHPQSCVDCLCCYPCGYSFWCPLMHLLTRQNCMILRLNNITNVKSMDCIPCIFCQPYRPEIGFTVTGHDPSKSLCNCCDVVAYPFWGFLMLTNLWIMTTPLVFVSQLLASIFTVCGLPCQDMPPALHNDCYQHRRYVVEQQRIPESHLQSKLITLCCWPCSECQVWRELKHNGIWPGLCLFAGSEADRATIEPTTVQRRLAVSNRLAGPMGPSPMGSPLTARIGTHHSE